MFHRQAALEVTARYCGRELEQYGQCVAAKPESWQRDCHHLKMSIAQCTSSHPIIRQIRQACAEPFEAFEECLRQNEAAVGNCAEHVRRFLQCADQVQPPRSPSNVEIQRQSGLWWRESSLAKSSCLSAVHFSGSHPVAIHYNGHHPLPQPPLPQPVTAA
uniref:Coiled-coil-helix-coiled-coil-helix domain containing 5 n=1 Tax=Felis catus TaxID=9685 RepID=A0ABI7Z6U4_FELCA